MLTFQKWMVVVLGVLGTAYCAKRELFNHDIEFSEKSITHSLISQLRLDERGINPGDLRIHQTYALPSGIIKMKLAQTYKGVSVFGAFIVGEKKNGRHGGSVMGEIVKGLHKDLKGNVNPKISVKEAVNACLQTIHGAIHKTEENVDFIVYAGFSYEREVTATIAYHVTIDAETSSGVVQPACLVDAMTGKIIKQWDAMASAVVNINSVGGNKRIGQYKYTSTGSVPGPNFPPLKAERIDATTCRLVSEFVSVYNLNGGYQPGRVKDPFSFPCANGFKPDVKNGAFSPLSDTFFYANETSHLYMKYLRVPPLQTNLKLYAHYGTFGPESAKAAYNNIRKNIVLGTGDSTYHPFATVDMIAHEIGHAFTYTYSKIVKKDEGYGLHEGFSDISAAMVKYELTGVIDFLFGNLNRKVAGTFIRDMCTPTRDGKSINNYRYYIKDMDGHYSCGIINRAFCILVRKPWWDVKTGFKVFAIANMKYWTQTTGFNHAVCGIEQAARDLGMPDDDVRDAFASVGCACPKSHACQNSVYGCKRF